MKHVTDFYNFLLKLFVSDLFMLFNLIKDHTHFHNFSHFSFFSSLKHELHVCSLQRKKYY